MTPPQIQTKDLISQISDDSWRPELEKASSKYNIIAAWVAVFFDPLFAFTDYFNMPASVFYPPECGCNYADAHFIQKEV